jgi:hypothetical protein
MFTSAAVIEKCKIEHFGIFNCVICCMLLRWHDPDEGTNEHADPVLAEHGSGDTRILSADSEIRSAWSRLWQRVVSVPKSTPAACQDVHGPDKGGVDHVQEEGDERCHALLPVLRPYSASMTG